MKPDDPLLNAGPDCVTIGNRWCPNCQRAIPENRWHQCPSMIERKAS